MRLFVFVFLFVLNAIECQAFVKASKSWVHFRDHKIIKQNFDYSCGAAAVASLLTYYYDHPITEEKVLDTIEKKGASSFQDLKKAIESFGFKAVGLAITWSTLFELKHPVIVHLVYKGQDHFSLIKHVEEKNIELADPSWGNRKLSIERFRRMFHTRKSQDYMGSILVVFPKK